MSKEVARNQPPADSTVTTNDSSVYPLTDRGYAPQNYGIPPLNLGNPTGYSQQYGAQYGEAGTQTAVLTQPTLPVVQVFREFPLRINCPHCHADIITAIHYVTGTLTWVICLTLILFGCVIGCCLFPFCTAGCQDVVHTCPKCQREVGRLYRI